MYCLDEAECRKLELKQPGLRSIERSKGDGEKWYLVQLHGFLDQGFMEGIDLILLVALHINNTAVTFFFSEIMECFSVLGYPCSTNQWLIKLFFHTLC